jgi:uncharacterized NAD(P)/FAD-binding protein YdhS
MADEPEPRSVAVIGAGASGTLAATRLLQHAAHLDGHLDVWLIDPMREHGRGPAYGTDDPRHLLNVPVGRMSAFAEAPDHFACWLEEWSDARGVHPYDRGVFVPRARFGEYLSDVLAAASRRSATARLHQWHDRVTHACDAATHLVLTLRSGDVLDVDAVVLATGNAGPDSTWAPASLKASGLFVADPWQPGALSVIPPETDVLIVGTGLTMADVAVSLGSAGRAIHAVSRHGLVPQAHLLRTPPVAATPRLPAPTGVAELRRAVLAHIARARRLHGDWRVGVDSLRSSTAALWQQLPVPERRRFLAEELRFWDVHRHRMAPATAQALDALRGSESLTISAESVDEAVPGPDGIRVRLAGGRALVVGTVVNCAGPRKDIHRSDDPLLKGLLSSGAARADIMGIGLDTFPDGRLRPAHGQSPSRIWTLGATRQGTLLESTAVPEIRQQADDVARSVVRCIRESRALGPTRPARAEHSPTSG